MRILGIDVSHHQGEVNWHAVAASEVKFCFIKSTEATAWIDPWFERNWQRAQNVGLYRGAYHFGRVGGDPEVEAAHFFSVVGALGFRDLPPVLDIEEGNGHSAADIVAWTKAFLAKAEQLFGRKPIVYTGHFWREQMGNAADAVFGQCPLWLAGYVPEANLQLPAAWKAWTFWQYTEGSHNQPKTIPGLPACDQNVFVGSAADLENLCSATAVTPPPPPPAPPTDNTWHGVLLLWQHAPAMSGDIVRKWQTRMAQLTFDVDVDGVYGPQSKRVCQAFQKNRGLTADGIVGRQTWDAAFAM